MKSLYISDLDGTLLDGKAELSEYSKQAINKFVEDGGYFAVSTARTAATVAYIMEGVNLSAPAILMNGVCTFDIKKREYIDINYISKDAVKQLIDVIKRHNLSGFIYTIDNGKLATYYENLNSPGAKAFVDERVAKYGKPFTKVDCFDLLSNNGVIYYSISDRKEPLTPAMEEIKHIEGLGYNFYRDIYEENCYFLEVSSSSASKYASLCKLKNEGKYERVVSFGDNLNDLGLFEASDYCVAVENARDEVKAKADIVIGKNTEDAVAKYLNNNK